MVFFKHAVKPRLRVIIDNDFGGDPDGLFQLAHHIASPAVQIMGIIGSFFPPGTNFGAPDSAAHACRRVNELLAVMRAAGKYPVCEGANAGLRDTFTPVISEGARLIVREAMRSDPGLPLFVTCGAGLTDVASAYLMEPEISKRLTLVWIGGCDYAAPSPPPRQPLEYNLAMDIKAAQVVFNISDIPLWQVPVDAYGQALTSHAELTLKVKPRGKTGEYLANTLEAFLDAAQKTGLELGEAYVLGDSPLVLLTALHSAFGRDPSSSPYVLRHAPSMNDEGSYTDNPAGRMIRVYTRIDTRLLFEDFFSKLTILETPE
jgi:purine nucleosidase